MKSSKAKIKETTLRLPAHVYYRAKAVVKSGSSDIRKLNDFYVLAIRRYLEELERKRIDDAFTGMATDVNYRTEAQVIASEFEGSDWEALNSK